MRLASRRLALSIALPLTVASLVPVPSSSAEDTPTASCADSRIVYDTSTLEKIVRPPERVLENEEGFWQNEKAQIYTTAWADNVGFAISREKWRRQIAAFADLTEDQRARSPLVRTTDSIVEHRDAFLARAIPHVCSYLPTDVNLDIPVHFTAFIPPRSMVTGGIVVNVAASYWNDNPDNILNNLVHEIFHVGYSHLRNARSEMPVANEVLHEILDTLQNEGVATWVGYEADSIFTAPDEIDYRTLEDPAKVTGLLRDVNAILGAVDTTHERELRKMSWDKGVTDRAYYIVGAQMARVIQVERGRKALIQTIVDGPVAFATLYNTLVEGDRQVAFEPSARKGTRDRQRRERARMWVVFAILVPVVFIVVLAAWRRVRPTG
jgi:hypothetical protein